MAFYAVATAIVHMPLSEVFGIYAISVKCIQFMLTRHRHRHQTENKRKHPMYGSLLNRKISQRYIYRNVPMQFVQFHSVKRR